MSAMPVQMVDPKIHSTYKTIAGRLKDCKIDLEKFIRSDLKVFKSTLEGISFTTFSEADKILPNDILAAFRRSSKYSGLPVFREGKKLDDKHFPIDVSMANTVGIGFREIWDPMTNDRGERIRQLKETQSSLGVTPLIAPFSDHFGERLNRIDVSSLHAAVYGTHCSIHVDETGFVLRGIGAGSDVSLSPEFARHTLLELIVREKLKIPDMIDLVVPDSQYSRFGVRAKLADLPAFRLEINLTCGLKCKQNWSTTVSASGSHKIFGG
jgi:hypothetical protein